MLKAILKFKSNRKNVEDGIGSFINKAVAKSVKIMEKNIKGGMHKGWGVDEGHLRRSITSRTTGFGKGEVTTGSIDGGKEVNYAVYVEYGTEKMAPRAFMRSGVGRSKKDIQQIFKTEARNVVTQVKGGKM